MERFSRNKSSIQKPDSFNRNVSSINAQSNNHQSFIGGGGRTHPSKSPSFDQFASVDNSNYQAQMCKSHNSPGSQKASPIKLEKSSSSSIAFTSTEWSPQDDGIEITPPSAASAGETPSREDVNASINCVLSGTPKKKRLPVFAEICPE